MKNLFLREYREQLIKSHRANPERYAWKIESIDAIMEHTEGALSNGAFDNRGESWKRTCKALGIKNTYKAIAEYCRLRAEVCEYLSGKKDGE